MEASGKKVKKMGCIRGDKQLVADKFFGLVEFLIHRVMGCVGHTRSYTALDVLPKVWKAKCDVSDGLGCVRTTCKNFAIKDKDAQPLSHKKYCQF
jgi:hypothetical protein